MKIAGFPVKITAHFWFPKATSHADSTDKHKCSVFRLVANDDIVMVNMCVSTISREGTYNEEF